MCDEARATREQCHDYREGGTWMAKHLNCKERAADRPNHSVNGVPHRIDPGDFIGKEFQEIENAGDRDDPRITEDLKRLVLRREGDPVKMDSQAGGEDCQVKVDSGKRGETERDAQADPVSPRAKYRQEQVNVTRELGLRANQETRMRNDEIMTNDEAQRAIVLRILIIRISSFLRD